jgi:hypothetical protein
MSSHSSIRCCRFCGNRVMFRCRRRRSIHFLLSAEYTLLFRTSKEKIFHKSEKSRNKRISAK